MRAAANLVFVLWSLSVVAEAAEPCPQERASDRVTHTVMYENDNLGHPSSDTNYTMGLSVLGSFTYEECRAPGWHRDTTWILERADRLFGATAAKANSQPIRWWHFGSTDFTPTDLTNPDPIHNDRPYASLLFLSAGVSREVDGAPFRIGTRAVWRDSEWYWGVLGTDIGKNVQTAIHRVCCRDKIPQGWSHQIGDGGSPTFMYETKWRQPLWPLDPGPAQGRADVQYSYGLSFGYYTRATLGASLRYGATPADQQELRVALPTKLQPHAVTRTGPVGFSFWLDYEMSAFLYNELLEGAWSGHNDVTYRYGQIYPVVHLVSTGFDLTFIPHYFGLLDPKTSHLFLSQQWKSPDLKDGPKHVHSWGGIYFSWSE